MMIVRNSFIAKPGMAGKLAAQLKEMGAAGNLKNVRVMTDVVDLLEKMGEAACFDSRGGEVIAQELECAEESASVISAS